MRRLICVFVVRIWHKTGFFMIWLISLITSTAQKINKTSWLRVRNYSHMSHLMTKPTNCHVRPAKTQISLGIRPVWSESSLSAWRKLWSLATHWAHSEDWSDSADAQAELRVSWAHCHFVVFFHELAHMLVQKRWWVMLFMKVLNILDVQPEALVSIALGLTSTL